METGGEGGCPFTAGKQMSDKNPVSPFLLGYPHLLEAKMVNCTNTGKLLTIWPNFLWKHCVAKCRRNRPAACKSNAALRHWPC